MKYSLALSAAILILSLSACSGKRTKVDSTSNVTEKQVDPGSNTTTALPIKESETLLPTFTVQDVNGKSINLQSLKGKKVFVNLWASWCPPCKREMPSIEKLYRTIDTSKVAFVMLSLDESLAKAKGYIEANKLVLPVYYPAANLPELFNVQSIPTTFIFNENGELMKRVDGSEEYDTDAYRLLLK